MRLISLKELIINKQYDITGRCQDMEDISLSNATFLGTTAFNSMYVFRAESGEIYYFNRRDLEFEEILETVSSEDIIAVLKGKNLPVRITLENEKGYATSSLNSKMNVSIRDKYIELSFDKAEDNF